MKYVIEVYETQAGKLPFHEWLTDLADTQARQIMRARLQRVELGNLGNTEPVGAGVSELKITFGPGYRVYFSKIGKTILLLLCAGTKRTQSKDIEKAKKYLDDYKMRGPTHAKK